MRKRDRKYIFLFILSLIGSVLVIFYRSTILNCFKEILLWDFFTLSVSLLVFCITIWHKIKYQELNFSQLKNIDSIKEVLREILDTITEPSIFVCSISILKGLYLDYFFDDRFFAKFNDAEKNFLLIASFCFLVTTFIELKTNAMELFFSSAEIDPSTDNADNVESSEEDDIE
jgi:hypothetical protein